MNFDAYTIRKMAPRLLVAVIAINLSIYLCLAAVDFTAVIGGGIQQLLLGPFEGTKIGNYELNGSAVGGVATAGLVGAVVAAAISLPLVGLGIVLLIALAALFILLFGVALVFLLVLRQGLLMFLIITSPVAIALFVLPGTEKYFKLWAKMFAAMLLIYPAAAAVFAITDIMVGLILQN